MLQSILFLLIRAALVTRVGELLLAHDLRLELVYNIFSVYYVKEIW